MTLSVQSLTKSYGPTKPILLDSNFIFEKGSIIGVLGRNGIGKTTLLRSLAQLEPIQKGEIFWDNHVLRKKEISFVSLSNDYYKRKTVERVIAEFEWLFTDFDSNKTKELLANVKIPLTERIDRMSTGSRQKFEIVLTLSRKVRLYLFDEPFSHLDYSSRTDVKQLIQMAITEDNIIVFTTNMLENMDRLMTDVVIFTDQQQLVSYNLELKREETNQSLKQLYMEVTQ